MVANSLWSIGKANMNNQYNTLKTDSQFKSYIQSLYDLKINSFKNEALLEIELTGKCRVNCEYCGIYSGEEAGELDLDRLMEFILTFRMLANDSGFKIVSLSLSGGDPLLYSHYREFVDFLTKRDIPFGLKANPSSITGKEVSFLKESSCQAVKMTFMGKRTVHNRYRGIDTFDTLVEKTKLLKSNSIPVVWHYTVGKFNIDNLDVDETLDSVMAAAPDALSLGRIARIGRLGNAEESFPDFTPLEFKAFLTTVLYFLYKNRQHGFNLMFREKLWVPLLCELGLLNLEDLGSTQNEKVCLGCDAYSRVVTVNYKGKLLLCGLLPSYQYGSIYENSNSIKKILFRRPLTLGPSSPCHSCSFRLFCRGCRGIAFAAGGSAAGSLYIKDPQCWVEVSENC